MEVPLDEDIIFAHEFIFISFIKKLVKIKIKNNFKIIENQKKYIGNNFKII